MAEEKAWGKYTEEVAPADWQAGRGRETLFCQDTETFHLVDKLLPAPRPLMPERGQFRSIRGQKRDKSGHFGTLPAHPEDIGGHKIPLP